MATDIRQTVRERYGAIAATRSQTSDEAALAVAVAFGYSPEQLAQIPAEANLGVSCGNPTAQASLRPGEVVVDLGCGGGLDVLLAAAKVGPNGRAIGIDMTPEMIELARRNAAQPVAGRAAGNVEFHLATIDRLPLADGSVDCVISNCVINLAPDKRAVFREIHRVLRPGGRLAISDIALKRPLPEEISGDLLAYVGCVAGAILVDEYRQGLSEVGMQHVEITDSGADLNAYALLAAGASCCGAKPDTSCGSLPIVQPQAAQIDWQAQMLELMMKYNVNDYAASVRVLAVKGE